ncbi:MAG: YjfB family protein [Treponema sp.]|nr:YjfB family protein [Treponema sp.]
MDIQSLSVNMSQARVQEEAAVLVQSKALNAVRDLSAELERLMKSGQVISDPARGNNLDLLA